MSMLVKQSETSHYQPVLAIILTINHYQPLLTINLITMISNDQPD